MLSALSEVNIDTVGMTITPTYTAPTVSDCVKSSTGMTAIGAMIGIYEAGAITQLATVGTAAITGANCIMRMYTSTTFTYMPFIQTASIQVSGLVANGATLQQVANSLMSLLNFNNHVIFTQEVTFS